MIVAMPIYNEADGIEETLCALSSALKESNFSFGFVIQNDASTDATLDVLAMVKSKLDLDLYIESNSSNLGHGPTTLRAYERATEHDPRVIMQLDSDGQFDARETVELCTAVINGYDAAIGVRRNRTDPFFRKIITIGLRVALKIAFRGVYQDPNSPIRAYDPANLRRLLTGIPKQPQIPNIYLTVLQNLSDMKLFFKVVTHKERAGTISTGTMWQAKSRVRQFVKLVKFCRLALLELKLFKSRLAKD